MILRFLDIFFMIFHSGLILLNLLGWIWRKTRRINLLLLVITGSSWLFLGMITGIPGYCPLTDWHFIILEKLGKTGLPSSYIKYLTDRITGLNFNPSLVDNLTLFTFLAALLISITLNLRDMTLKRRKLT